MEKCCNQNLHVLTVEEIPSIEHQIFNLCRIEEISKGTGTRFITTDELLSLFN